jgi:type I restriction enzyme S subunit
MTFPEVPLSEILLLANRPESPVGGKLYRQIGVRLWGEGAYEREPIDGAATQYQRLFQAKANDVIVNKIWARNGSVAVVPEQLDGCYGSNEFPMFIPRREKLEPRWFHWLTKTKGFWTKCDEKSRGTSGKNRIRSERFLQIKIPLPPLAEQRRITAKIEELAIRCQEAHGLRQRIMKDAEALAKAYERKLFDQRGRDGWRNLEVEDVCDEIIDYRGRTPPISNSGIPHITSTNIKNGRIEWQTTKFVSQETYENFMTRGIPGSGDVIFTMEAPLGQTAVVPDDRLFSLAQRILLLRGSRRVVDSSYFAMVLMSPDVRDRIYSQATGTTVKGIASKRLRHVVLPIPSLPDQHRIVSSLDEFRTSMDELRGLQMNVSVELDRVLPSVLDKAFEGELA